MTGRAATSGTPGSEVVDQSLLDAARVVQETLVRVHPSFRFEERLAGRLASRWMRAVVGGGTSNAPDDDSTAGAGAVIPFPLPAPLGALEAIPGAFDLDPDSAVATAAPDRASRRRTTRRLGAASRSAAAPRFAAVPRFGPVPRGALIGGAIASGFSLAGAAFLARRWLHRPARPAQSGRGAA